MQYSGSCSLILYTSIIVDILAGLFKFICLLLNIDYKLSLSCQISRKLSKNPEIEQMVERDGGGVNTTGGERGALLVPAP